MEEYKCAVCKADFKAGHLVGGTCEVCKKLYPGVSTKDELKKAPEDKEEEKKLQATIQTEINKLLEGYGLVQKCVCGNLFHRRSPAQRSCGCVLGTAKKGDK